MRLLTLTFLLSILMIPAASAGEILKDIDIGGSMPFYTSYIWRAQNLVDDPVFQPAAYVSYKGFSFNFWSNWDVVEGDEFTEIDYTWDYSTDLGFIAQEEESFLSMVNVTGGYTFYTFPDLDDDDTSHEAFTGISLDTMLNPSYTAYWDFDEGDGWYHEWGIGHTFDLDPVSVDTGLSMGLNIEQWGFDTSLTALNFSGKVSVPLDRLFNIQCFKYVTLRPDIMYSLPLDDQYEHELYGGLHVGIDL